MTPPRPTRGTRPPAPAARGPRRAAPVLARQLRGEIVESVHRGHVVRVDGAGRVTHVVGDAEAEVSLRSCVKPFALVALAEAGGFRHYGLSSAEIALLASSHSGEDLHVRTLQAVFRRSGLSQTLLACGTEGAPLDALTAARLARDGERAGPIRHMCSGSHAAMLLLARLGDWSLEDYWQPGHPAQVAVRSAVARAFEVTPERLRTAVDGCGVETFAFPLASVARAFAFLADPDAVPADDPRQGLSALLRPIRDAMAAHPEMVAGTRERLDTSLMKALPGRLVVKGGAEGLRGVAVLPDPARRAGASALAVKVEDGGGHDRAIWAATVEALRLAEVLGGQALRVLGRYHRPVELDPHGRIAAETVPGFDLAPVGELIG
ncbi:MAG TPA: asparaginase [Patescibacteria group bacterium]|nr:asparaginase [Patescibacteria group bacterium]